MTNINDNLKVNYLIEQPNIDVKKDYTTVSQQAMIGSHKVNIVLNFKRQLNRNEATQAMQENLAKVADIVNSSHLGEESISRPILSVTLHPKSSIEEKTVNKFMASQGRLLPQTPNRVSSLPPRPTLSNKDEKTRDVAHDMLTPPGPPPELPPRIPPPLPSSPTLSANETSKNNVGKVLTYKHKIIVDGVAIEAMEKAERADTVQTVIEGLETKIEALTNKLADLKQQPPSGQSVVKMRVLEKELEKARSSLSIYTKHAKDATHGSANMPRFAFRGLGRETAKNEMAPILTNLRMQTVENAEGKIVSAVTRSGAITDFRNGEVSLRELKDLRDLENYRNLKPERKKFLAKFYTLEVGNEAKHAESIALLIKTKALVAYGGENLASSLLSDRSKTVLKKLASSSTIESQFEKLSKADKNLLAQIPIDDTKLTRIVSERSNFLKMLVLQDLELHLKTTPPSKGPILYSRTSIVDLNKIANNEFGCIIHERTQGLDTKAVFDELQGSSVIFDCKPNQKAYIDDEGQIHMAKTYAGPGVNKLELNPVFFNICVQGSSDHLFNVGMQKSINDEALANLEKHYGSTQELTKLKNSLTLLTANNTTDPSEAAFLSTQCIQKLGGYSGVNCFGGKDRTGYILALVTFNKLAEMSGLDVNDPEMRKVGRKLLDPKGIAAKVAKDNADHTTMKLLRTDLQLYDTKTNKGKMLRTAHGCNAAYLAMDSQLKKKVGLSGISESSTPGQIYQR